MSNVRFRGCCCGIPFGCGVLVLALLAVCLWKLVAPGDLWPSGAVRGLALLAVPGVVLALRVGTGPRQR
ncbi:MAG: hypothetical protein QOF89_3724 [Acidobacteriota bacterium]|jgi:hypothetical protein|nr:hypothetical protein [Acidobacteriota bacterium]